MPWINVNGKPPIPPTLEDLGYVQVVRCKDCKHWTKEDDRCLELGWCRVHERRFVEEWFCADGEKAVSE